MSSLARAACTTALGGTGNATSTAMPKSRFARSKESLFAVLGKAVQPGGASAEETVAALRDALFAEQPKPGPKADDAEKSEGAPPQPECPKLDDSSRATLELALRMFLDTLLQQ